MNRQATEHKTANERRDELTEPRLANAEAEAALLGAMMVDNSIIAKVSEVIAREDFFYVPHGDIFRAIMRLHANNEIASPVTLKPIFEGDYRFVELGGVGYLAQLTGSGVALVGAYDFAKQVAELAAMRRSREALYEAIEQLENTRDVWPDLGTIQGDLETKLWAERRATTVTNARDVGDAVKNVRARLKRAREATVGFRNLWISDLNTALGELEPQTYTVIAGRPSMGKTVWGVSSALGYAAGGTPWLYLHAEMSAEQMDLRVICDLAFALGSTMTLDRLRKGQLTDDEDKLLDRIVEMRASMPIDFVDVGRCDVAEVRSRVRRADAKWKARGRKLGGVTVDYLQLLRADSILGARGANDPRASATAISGALLDIAKKEHVAMVALSQLSRKTEDRADSVPQLSDLRESGRIEEDADAVGLLYRAEYYLERMPTPTKPKELEDHEAALGAARGKCDFIVPKNRHGKAMKRTMNFYGAHSAMRGGDHTEYNVGMFDNQGSLFEEGK